MDEAMMIYRQIGIDSLYKIWHKLEESVMLLYVHSGDGSIVFGDAIYPIQSGTLCFIGSQKYHYTMPESPEAYVRTKLLLPVGDFIQLRRMMGADDGFLHRFTAGSATYALLPPDAQEEACAMLERIEGCTDRYRPTALLTAFAELLVQLDRHGGSDIRTPDGTITRAIYYIHRHLSESITVDTLCEEVHLSKYYFCRLFKEKTGFTPMEYIKSTRLAVARQMLEETSRAVSDVAERCGFTSCSYFCRSFKESFGITAYAYRQKHSL